MTKKILILSNEPLDGTFLRTYDFNVRWPVTMIGMQQVWPYNRSTMHNLHLISRAARQIFFEECNLNPDNDKQIYSYISDIDNLKKLVLLKLSVNRLQHYIVEENVLECVQIVLGKKNIVDTRWSRRQFKHLYNESLFYTYNLIIDYIASFTPYVGDFEEPHFESHRIFKFIFDHSRNNG